MKIFLYILISLGLISIVYNASRLDFSNLFEGESYIASVSILGGLCAVVLLVILRVSLMIAEKEKQAKRKHSQAS